jgi:hypothetical protein
LLLLLLLGLLQVLGGRCRPLLLVGWWWRRVL